MGRVIVFDKNTLGKLPEALAARVEISTSTPENALECLMPAIESGQETILMLPTAAAGQVRMIRVYRRELAPTPMPPEPVYEATGFLGLTDVHIADDVPDRQRSWWQRIWS